PQPANVSDNSITDLTLKAEQSASKFFVNLYETANLGHLVVGAELKVASDLTVNISRLGGDPARTAFGDTLRIDLDTFSSIKNFVSGNGGLLSIDFKGGTEVPFVSDDHVFVVG